MPLINLYVDHMTCAKSVISIKSVLGVMDGVEGIDIDLELGQIHVTRSFNRFQDLVDALISAGFPAVVNLGGVSPYSKNTDGNSCCCG